MTHDEAKASAHRLWEHLGGRRDVMVMVGSKETGEPQIILGGWRKSSLRGLPTEWEGAEVTHKVVGQPRLCGGE